MDNKAYLDQIAVKSQNPNTGSLLSPGLIKLLIGAFIAVVVMLVVGNILSSGNNKTSSAYDELYYRISVLSGSTSPLVKYDNRLKSSDLRTYSGILHSNLSSAAVEFNAIAGSIGIDTAALDATATQEYDASIAALDSKLEAAYLTGQFDRTYAYEIYDQITQLIALETSVKLKASDENLATLINNSLVDLESAQRQFKSYTDSPSY